MNIQPLVIGPLPLATNLLLAPLAGYCDLAFRLVVREQGGVGLASTDLLCSEGIRRQSASSLTLAATCPEDSPLCIQLYGADGESLAEAAAWAQDHGAHVVDLNMGCPVDKVTKRNGGGKLLCDPDHALRMVERIRARLTRVPLTCKLRLGWDDSSIVAPYLARRLEELGVDLITVHGRTAVMKFGGTVRLEGIAAVVAAVRHIPVVGNGDVKTPQDALRMIQATGCAGVMIGRGALVRPWIFRDTWSFLTTGRIPPEPGITQKCDTIRRHFHNLLRFRNEHAAVSELRQRISWYARAMHPCRPLKEAMRRITSAADFERTVAAFLEWRAGRAAAPTEARNAEHARLSGGA